MSYLETDVDAATVHRTLDPSQNPANLTVAMTGSEGQPVGRNGESDDDRPASSVGEDFMQFVGALVSERHELAELQTRTRKPPNRAGRRSPLQSKRLNPR
jgi:hypothetical protein